MRYNIAARSFSGGSRPTRKQRQTYIRTNKGGADIRPNILVCVGTRADTVKMAPLYLALKESGWAQVSLLNCGQHREMTDSVLSFFSIIPDHRLDVMRHGQSPDTVVERVREGASRLLSGCGYDLVLVHGDTASSLGVALACSEHGVLVAHIEAGLRSGDECSPYPEEIYRRRITGLSSYHFAPTDTARGNLLREGIEPACIHTVGNTVIDALSYALDRGLPPSPMCGRYALLTLHRRENLIENGGSTAAERVFSAIYRLLCEHSGLSVLFPIHKNERVRELFSHIPRHDRLIACEPMDYPHFVSAMRTAHFIISDSGGVTEEAAYLGVPVMITRTNTERGESVSEGCAILCGTDEHDIYITASRLASDDALRDSLAHPSSSYGTGDSSLLICRALRDICCK